MFRFKTLDLFQVDSGIFDLCHFDTLPGKSRRTEAEEKNGPPRAALFLARRRGAS